jgi:hypothetical protein
MYSCLKFDIEISMLEEKSLMVLIVLENLKYNKKSTFKSETVKPVHSPGFTAYCNIGCMHC